MIVQPDFLDHWKVSALAARIGRLEAITALIALWAHCQQRRLWRFEFTDLMLAGICRFTGDATLLKNTLLELRLIDLHPEGGYEVHEWAEVNASLVHNWEVGSRGGRPKKEPLGNPRVNPRVMPRETLGEPEAKPIREEERRADQTREDPPPPIVPQGTWGDRLGRRLKFLLNPGTGARPPLKAGSRAGFNAVPPLPGAGRKSSPGTSCCQWTTTSSTSWKSTTAPNPRAAGTTAVAICSRSSATGPAKWTVPGGPNRFSRADGTSCSSSSNVPQAQKVHKWQIPARELG